MFIMFCSQCIDNFARSIGYNTSTDLPDKVLQFVRDHPLMDNSVNPIGNRPVLLKRGSNYTRIVVDRVTGLDKQTYDVMFLGTGKCFSLRKRYSTFLCILFQIFFFLRLQKSRSIQQLCLKFCIQKLSCQFNIFIPDRLNVFGLLDIKRLSLETFHIKGDLT